MEQQLNNNEFYRLLTNLYQYFGREKYPTKERSDLLFQKVFNLEAAITRKAFDRIMDDYDNLPANIPKAIRKSVFSLKAADPDHAQSKAFTPGKYGPCKDCNGYGMFYIRHSKNNIRYEGIKHCGSCRNWQHWTNDPGELVTAKQLEIRAVEFVPYNKLFDLMSYKGYAESKGNLSINF